MLISRHTCAAIAGALLLSACASQGRMPVLNQYNAEFSPWASSEAVSAVAFTRSGGPGDIPGCVAATVSNQGQTLSDSSGSFFGAYTGNYYRSEQSSQVAGGSVIEYVAPDGGSVVASGSTEYSAGALVSRAVRFKLSVKQQGDGRKYRYTGIQQAQSNTGAAANTGFTPVGAWAGANPDMALASLERLTDSIESCIGR